MNVPLCPEMVTEREIWGWGLDSGVGIAICRWVQTEARGQGFEGGQGWACGQAAGAQGRVHRAIFLKKLLPSVQKL